MSVLDRLASALGRRDEEPNVALARELATSEDRAGIAQPAKRARLEKALRRLARL